ncbi:MAG: hypothetical protein ACXVDD_14310, partial [Polyangia bacterium]
PDGLVGELLARRRKRLPRLTLALIVLVGAAVAFIGGAEVQKHFGTSSSTSNGIPSSFARAFAGGSPPSGASFPGFGGGNSTTGTVTLIKGATLYVTNAAGNTVLVKTSAQSRVTKSVPGSVKTIHPGDSVTVTGSQNKDGSVTARQVTVGGGNG